MFSSDSYCIRPAREADQQHLLRLSILDSQRELTAPALIGEINGMPAAAISLTSGRVVADPFAPTEALAAHLRARAHALQASSRGPGLAERLLGAPRQARWA